MKKNNDKKTWKIVGITLTSLIAIMLILGIVDQCIMFTGASNFIGSFSCFTFIAILLIVIGIIAWFVMLIKARQGCDDVKEIEKK